VSLTLFGRPKSLVELALERRESERLEHILTQRTLPPEERTTLIVREKAVDCAICGGPLPVVRGGNRIYCSAECAKKAKSAAMKAERNGVRR
jgi:hypothetical protein